MADYNMSPIGKTDGSNIKRLPPFQQKLIERRGQPAAAYIFRPRQAQHARKTEIGNIELPQPPILQIKLHQLA